VALITGLVDLGSIREDMYPTRAAPQRPARLLYTRKFMNGVHALHAGSSGSFTVKANTRVGLSFEEVLFVEKGEWLLRLLDFVYIVTVIDNGNMNVVFFLLI